MPSPPSSSRTLLWPTLVLLLGSTLWGLTWAPLRYFADWGLYGTSVTLVGYGSVGGLALMGLASRARRLLPAWRGLAVIAVLGGLANLCFATALVLGDAVRVMVLFYLLPAWGVLGGRIFLGETIDTKRYLCLACALVGAFLTLGGVQVLSLGPSRSDLLALASGLALALNNVAFRKFNGIPVDAKIGAMFVGCLFLAGALTLFGSHELPRGVPAEVWAQLVAFGLIWLLAATVATMWGVSKMEASRSSLLMVMELVTAVVSAAILTRSSLSVMQWGGGALTLLAALVEAKRA